MLDSIDDSLYLNASQAVLAAEVDDGVLKLPENFVDEPEHTELSLRGLTLRVLSPESEVIWTIGPFSALPAFLQNINQSDEDHPLLETLSHPVSGERIRIISSAMTDNEEIIGVIQVIQTLKYVDDTLSRLLIGFYVGIPVIVIFSGLGGYFLAGETLRPINQITDAASRISGENLSARIAPAKKYDEVGRLASAFNLMLDRLERAFNRERQFSQDASHELRTPLAAIQAIHNVTRQRERKLHEYEQALDDIAEEAKRLESLTSNLLYLARGDRHWVEKPERINLKELIGEIVATMQPLVKEKDLELLILEPKEIFLQGDEDSLILMFINLLENAIKYTERGSIEITTRVVNEDRLSIQIADSGIGIAAEHLPHIFERFYRIDQSRSSEGNGLGLAIALEIARAHGGMINVVSKEGQGSKFFVDLPTRAKE